MKVMGLYPAEKSATDVTVVIPVPSKTITCDYFSFYDLTSKEPRPPLTSKRMKLLNTTMSIKSFIGRYPNLEEAKKPLPESSSYLTHKSLVITKEN